MRFAQHADQHIAYPALMQGAYAHPMEKKPLTFRKLRRQKKLNRVLQEHGGVTAVALAIGAQKSHLSAMSTGDRGVGDEIAERIETILGYEPGWFDFPDTDTAPVLDSVRVPHYHNGASMGRGADLLLEDAVAGDLLLRKDWLSRNLHPCPPFGRLAFITAYGDSMAPTLRSGNILLIDTGHTAPDISGIYVLEANDQLFVKRVSRRLDGRIVVTSDNELGVVEELQGKEKVRVKGRVVYVWKGESL